MTSPLVVGLNTYVSASYASTYLGDSPRGQAWAGIDPDSQAQFLIAATRNFQKQAWVGLPTQLVVVRSAAVVSGGTGYSIGDLLSPVGGTGEVPAQVRVAAVSSGAVTSIALVDEGLYLTAPSGTLNVTGGGGLNCTLTVTTGLQSLAFPRTSLTDVDGLAVDPDAVPVQVLEAECEYAMDMAIDASVETSAGTGSNDKLYKAGSVEIERFRPTDGPRNLRFSTIVLELLRPFMGGQAPVLSIVSGTDAQSSFTPSAEYGLTQGFA